MRRTPTETDKTVGQYIRDLRQHNGQTLLETVTKADLGISPQTLSRIELGEKRLTRPLAKKLAKHFWVEIESIIPTVSYSEAELRDIEERCAPPATEQEWLGNDKPALFAVPDTAPDHIAEETAYVRSRTLEINLDAPLSLADYREQVWIPYLEHRYATDLRQTG